MYMFQRECEKQLGRTARVREVVVVQTLPETGDQQIFFFFLYLFQEVQWV